MKLPKLTMSKSRSELLFSQTTWRKSPSKQIIVAGLERSHQTDSVFKLSLSTAILFLAKRNDSSLLSFKSCWYALQARIFSNAEPSSRFSSVEIDWCTPCVELWVNDDWSSSSSSPNVSKYQDSCMTGLDPLIQHCMSISSPNSKKQSWLSLEHSFTLMRGYGGTGKAEMINKPFVI